MTIAAHCASLSMSERSLCEAGLPPSWACKHDAAERVQRSLQERYGQDYRPEALCTRRKKLLWHHSNKDPAVCRPAYYGSWSKSMYASHQYSHHQHSLLQSFAEVSHWPSLAIVHFLSHCMSAEPPRSGRRVGTLLASTGWHPCCA